MYYSLEVDRSSSDKPKFFIVELDRMQIPAKTPQEAREICNTKMGELIRTRFGQKFDRPIPTECQWSLGCVRIELPLSMQCKIWLHNSLIEKSITRTQLGNMMEVSKTTVDRMLDLRTSARIDLVIDALREMGHYVKLRVDSE